MRCAPLKPRTDSTRRYGRTNPCLLALSLLLLGTGTARAATTCPTGGHDVSITSPCTFDAGTYTFTGTLTISTTVTAASNIGNAKVRLDADHIRVTSTGRLTADGMGFAAASGPGYNADNPGAAHGGLGGGRTGQTYGDVDAPTTLGSGGLGAAGGGAIHLRVPVDTGTVTIDGVVTANGGSNSGVCVLDGGAGGSVWIETGVLGGTGSITARGGTSCLFRRAGGGGRVSIGYSSIAPAATLQNSVSAAGGASAAIGGAGTVRWEQFGGDERLVLDNGGNIGAPTVQAGALEQWHEVVIKGGAQLEVGLGKTLEILQDGKVLGDSPGRFGLVTKDGSQFIANSAISISDFNVKIGGDFSAPGLKLASCTFELSGDFVGLSDLTIGAGATLTRRGTSPLTVGALLVESGGVLTHAPNNGVPSVRALDREKDHLLDLRAEAVTVEAGGRIHGDAAGYGRMMGPGRGHSPGLGASHGGLGGRQFGNTYDDFRNPAELGSGGNHSNFGGLGGGLLRIAVTGPLVLDGTISANGEDGLARAPTDLAGGGSGGSIRIDAEVLRGNGSIEALGGDNLRDGGGGGGRVAIVVGLDESSILPTLTPLPSSRVSAHGGASGPDSGGAGTVYVERTDAALRTLLVDNNGNNTPLSTPIAGHAADDFRIDLEELILVRRGNLVIASGTTLGLAPDGVLATLPSPTRSVLEVQSEARVELPTDATRVSDLDLLIDEGGSLLASADLEFDTSYVFLGGRIDDTVALDLVDTYFVDAGQFSAGLQSLVIGAGAVFERQDTLRLDLDTLLIEADGTLTHGFNSAVSPERADNGERDHSLDIRANRIEVEAGGKIDVDGRGYAAGRGRGSGTGTHGASHGGVGGLRDEGTYGDLLAPQDAGSGGGDVAEGGAGGGVVILEVLESLLLDGLVTANGAAARSAAAGGGGAGGSISVTTDVLTGLGELRAEGGAGRGAGGGGRIAVAFQARGNGLLPADLGMEDLARVSAAGGPGATEPDGAGGAGTIAVTDRSGTRPFSTLIVDNKGRTSVDPTPIRRPLAHAASGVFELRHLVLSRGGQARIEGPLTVSMVDDGGLIGRAAARPSLELSGAAELVLGARVDVDGLALLAREGTKLSAAGPDLRLVDSDLRLDGTLVSTANLLLEGSRVTHSGTIRGPLRDLVIGQGSVFESESADVLTLNNVTVKSGGRLTHVGHAALPLADALASKKLHVIDLRARDLTVEPDGHIDADGRGYAAGAGPGAGSAARAGGALGGRGGAGGLPYGDLRAPFDLGSGGHDALRGGAGGGLIKLTLSGSLRNDGRISANGEEGTLAAPGLAGSGSGGSIQLAMRSLEGQGLIEARGGSNAQNGAGGGGRILLDFQANRSGIVPTSAATSSSRLDASGGASPLAPGGAGTVVIVDRSNAAQTTSKLLLDNAGRIANPTPLRAPLPVAGTSTEIFDEIALRGASRLEVPVGVTLVLPTAQTLRTYPVAANMRPRLTVRGVLELPAEIILNDLDLDVSGALKSGGHLRLNRGHWLHEVSTPSALGGVTLGAESTLEVGGLTPFEVAETFAMLSGATATHRENTSAPSLNPPIEHQLAIVAEKIDIDSGAAIDVSVRGHSRGAGPGRGTSGITAGGGGHGGAGGASSASVAGGAAHGDPLSPITLGSGGGDDTNGSGAGGSGGGFVALEACESIQVDGRVLANGQTGRANEGGGGAGGTIRIATNLLAGAGEISAGGGAGAASGGGGGGGGRVLMRTQQKPFGGAVGVEGGAGGGAAAAGLPGSIEDLELVDAICPERPCGRGPCAGVQDPVTGECDMGANDGVECGDGDQCTEGDVCQAGACVAGTPRTCDDGNLCSDDSCDSDVGCVHVANTAPCDEGDKCTENDICKDFVCSPGAALDCDDGNSCTTDSCTASTGCEYDNLADAAVCDDGNPCTDDDECGAGICGGTPAFREGCYGAFPGDPVIGPPLPDVEIADGATHTVDLTTYEHDLEDGPASDTNTLTWTLRFDPGLIEAEIDPRTEVLTITPTSPDFPFETTVIARLRDSDGNVTPQSFDVIHRVSDYLLTVKARPNPARPANDRVIIEATLSSPAGRAVKGRAIRFSMPEGDGTMFARVGMTDESGVAKTVVLTGPTIRDYTIRAEHTSWMGPVAGETTLEVKPPPYDVGLYVLDLTFHDPETDDEIVPGDVNPLRAGEPVIVRAGVRNLGGEAAPELDVRFQHRLVAFDPPGVGDAELIGEARTSPIAAKATATAEVLTSFRDDGFHILEVIVDPSDAFIEGDETNNRASQGFWVGLFDNGTGEDRQDIRTTCELTGGTLSPTGVPTVHPEDMLELSGRADYWLLLPIDSDGSQGLAGVRGGVVSLKLLDEEGLEYPSDDFPVSGDDPEFDALHTLADAEEPSAIGQFPNRSPDDVWDVMAPTEFGCYTLVSCVSDGTSEGCCESQFCVVPKGPAVTCDGPTTPMDGTGTRMAPAVGVETTLSALIANNGDYETADMKARLLIDDVQVGPEVAVEAIAPDDTGEVSLPWTPTCGGQAATIELTWRSAFDGQTETATTSCTTTMPDVEATEMNVEFVDGCDFELIVDKTVAQTVDIPGAATGALFNIRRPDGLVETRKGTVDLTRSTYADYTFARPGTYTIEAVVDGPLAPATACGEAPELEERANNTVSREFCADPSPFAPEAIADPPPVIDVAWPVIYGVPTTVRARFYNQGTLPVNVPLEAILTTSQGPVLVTNRDGDGDKIRIDASCDAPISNEDFVELEWEWTPQYPPDGGREVRDLQVITDVRNVYATCDGASANNAAVQRFNMNLYPTMTTGNEMLLDSPISFSVDVNHRGTLRPNDEGSIVRFDVVRDGGQAFHADQNDIVGPTEDTPQNMTFSWTPTAADCNVILPMKYVRSVTDANNRYIESNEGDNEARWHLPDLAAVSLRQESVGCTSKLLLKVVDKAPAPSIPASDFDVTITVTGPEGAQSVFEVKGLTELDEEIDLSAAPHNVFIDTRVAGTYNYTVDIDPSSESACGAILESNERNNRFQGRWTLCPDPAVFASGLKPAGRLQRDVNDTFDVTVENVGNIAIHRDVAVRLATFDGPLANLAEPVAFIRADCTNPILPKVTGESFTGDATWAEFSLSPRDPVDAIVATVDPNNDMPEECLATNNQAWRNLYLDISPWLDWRGANAQQNRDISSDSRPQWGSVAEASHKVAAMRPRPGVRNSRREPLSGALQVYPGPAETTIDYNFIRQFPITGRQRTQRFDSRPLEGAADDYRLTYPLGAEFEGVNFTQEYCIPENPITAVEVVLDPGNLVLENLENNNRTTRNLPDLRMRNLELSPVVNDRVLLSYGVNGSAYKEFYLGEWEAVAELTRPDGTVETIPLEPQDGPYTTCQGCEPRGSAAEPPIKHNEGIDTPVNGLYRMKVTVDPPREDARCGDVPERNELNNSLSTAWYLCPELAVSVRPVPPTCEEAEEGVTEWTVEVIVTNSGARDLIEDIEVRLEALDALNLPIPAAFSDMQTVNFNRDAPLERTGKTELEFTWDPTAPGPAVSRIAAFVTVLDTDENNGEYPAWALCSKRLPEGESRSGSAPVEAGKCTPPPPEPPDPEDPNGEDDLGCKITIAPAALSACNENSISFSAVRPIDGETITGDDIDSLEIELLRIDPDGFYSDDEYVFEEEEGVWTSTMEFGADALGSALTLAIKMQLSDGSLCFAQEAFMVEGATGGVSISEENIEFLSLNDDGTEFTHASVGDIAEIRMTVTTDGECGARDIFGRAYIDLAFSKVELGTWYLPLVEGGTETPVDLVPLLNQPQVPEPGEDGAFLWRVSAPSPWIHLVTLVVETLEGEPMIATRPLFVGRFPSPLDPAELEVTVVDPEPGGIERNEEQVFTFRVSKTGDEEGEPVLPEELARLEAVFTDADGELLAEEPIDMLASDADHLGDGEFVVRFDTTAIASSEFTVTVQALLHDGGTGMGEGVYTFEDEDMCESGEPLDDDTGFMCVECLDEDGDGHLGLTETCVDGTDCDDSERKSTTTDIDEDCDGSVTEDDCDDTDEEIIGPCPIECETEEAIDVAVGEVSLMAEDCVEGPIVLSLGVRNEGERDILAETTVAVFLREPDLGVTPAFTFTLDEATLTEGSLPLEAGAELTLLYEAPELFGGALSGEVWVVVNHERETPFAVREEALVTSGALPECTLDNNMTGPVQCESEEPPAECETDEDCGLAADRCDVRVCADGVCMDSDDGTTWAPCEDREIFYVRVTRGDEVGYVICAPARDGSESAECDLDEDGNPVIHPTIDDLICEEEVAR
jgi:hypothetical protein